MVDITSNLPPQSNVLSDKDPSLFGGWVQRPTLRPEIIGGAATAGAAADTDVIVLHIDERTGRRIIQTGTNPDTGLPNGSFEPVRVADVIIPYDQ